MNKMSTNPKIFIGVSFILLIFFSSLAYYFFTGDTLPETGFLKNEEGKLLKQPYNPSQVFPFGTDVFGRELFFVMLSGAKYTLGIAFTVALLRLLFSAILGVFIRLYLPKIKNAILNILDTINFFPATLLCFFFLHYALYYDYLVNDGFTTGSFYRIILSLFVLTFVALPQITTMFIKETDRSLKKEYMEAVNVLGGNNIHKLKRHILPDLYPQFFFIYIREFIQVLLLMAHIAILRIFVGGMIQKYDVFQNRQIISSSNEWSGLIGAWWQFMWTGYPWLPFIPVLLLTVTILSAKLILAGIQDLNSPKMNQKAYRIKNSVERPRSIKEKFEFTKHT